MATSTTRNETICVRIPEPTCSFIWPSGTTIAAMISAARIKPIVADFHIVFLSVFAFAPETLMKYATKMMDARMKVDAKTAAVVSSQ